MKIAKFAVAAISLLEVAVAQPFGRRHGHRRKHVRRRENAAVVTIVETFRPTKAPEAIVFVNQFGKPLSTMTDGMLAELPSFWTEPTKALPSISSTSSVSIIPTAVLAIAVQGSSKTFSSSPTTWPPSRTPEAASTPSSLVPQFAPSSATFPVPPPPLPTASIAPPRVPTKTASTPPPPSSAPPPPVRGGYGFSYSPYMADGSCKTQDQISQDFATIGGGYSMVRVYGTDCNQVATVLLAAKAHGLKLFAGIFDLGTINAEITTIISAAAGDWSSFDTISIGNELVNSGKASAAAVVAAIGTARTLLKQVGYTGRIVTVDTLVAARANPSLCDASDYCAVNSHPFFDGNVLPADSGSFLTTQASTLRAVLANKNQEIMITETGWPTQGGTNGVAVPSVANQATALSAIKATFAGNQAGVILFTVFNDLWKTSGQAQFSAEQFWGFLGNAPSG